MSVARNALLVLIAFFGLMSPKPVWAVLKVTNVFYGWDENQLKYQNSNDTISPNGQFTPLIHQFSFDTTHVFSIPQSDPCTEPITPNSTCDKNSDKFVLADYIDHVEYQSAFKYSQTGCFGENGTSTTWAGTMQLALNHTDTNGAPGFQQSRFWELTACDRNASGTGLENGDLTFTTGSQPFEPVPPPSSAPNGPYFRYTISQTETSNLDPNPTVTGAAGSIDLIQKDVVSACSTGNCADQIITTLFVNLDRDCDGQIDSELYSHDLATDLANKGLTAPAFDPDPNDNTGTGMCFYAEAQKPYPNNPSWSGNLQATIAAGGGAKTVNFSVTPTAALISQFDAVQRGGQTVVTWETVSEVNTAGFNIERLDGATGKYVRVNDSLIPALPYAPQGGKYWYPDDQAQIGGQYTYRLIEVENSGHTVTNGPYTVTVSQQGVAQSQQAGNQQTVSGGSSTFGSSANLPTEAETHRAERAEEVRKQGLAKHDTSSLNTSSLNTATLSSGPGNNAARIDVTDDGVYYVSASDISAALGLDANTLNNLLNKGGLRLTNRGNDVAWIPAGHGEGLYFYGQAIDSLYTDKNVYWLAPGEGTVMNVDQGRPPKTSTSDGTYVAHVHAEKDLTPVPFIVQDPDTDFWFWDYVYTADSGTNTKDFTIPLSLPGAANSGTASITVHLHGSTDLSPGNDHDAVVYVNGTRVGDATADGQSAFDVHATFDQSLLSNGDNEVKIAASSIAGVSYSVFWIDSVDLSYSRHYQAESDELTFDADNQTDITVTGFSSPDIEVYDVTDPNRPEYYKPNGLRVDQDGSGYKVSFSPANRQGRYLALVGAAVRNPVSVTADQSSNLKDAGNGVDYLVITPSSLDEGAQALAAYRASHGYSTGVVSLQDIYDEFNDGIVDPYAIRDFLAYAYKNWSKAPEFVVLAGNGTWDQKDRLGLGTSLFPILLAPTSYGVFPADTRFADVVGDDGIPEYALGRIPVLSSEELLAYLDKVKTYESDTDSDWANHALLLADNPDDGGDFYAESDAVADSLPARFSITKVYHDPATSGSTTRQAVLDVLNGTIGASLFNYVGHGGASGLGTEGFLRLQDVSSLTNASRLPVFVAMTCGVANSAYPGYDSLVEKLLVYDNGGAVAAVAPTGMSFSGEANTLNIALTQAMYGENASASLGQAFDTALGSSNVDLTDETFRTYSVFGDPALTLNMR